MSEKYEIITFNNLLDAIDMIRESDFDIILLDEELAWFNIAEAKKKLTSIGKDFITIALIDEDSPEKIEELKKADIYSYLLKPVQLSEVNLIMLPAFSSLDIIKENKRLEAKLNELEERN